MAQSLSRHHICQRLYVLNARMQHVRYGYSVTSPTPTSEAAGAPGFGDVKGRLSLRSLSFRDRNLDITGWRTISRLCGGWWIRFRFQGLKVEGERIRSWAHYIAKWVSVVHTGYKVVVVP